MNAWIDLYWLPLGAGGWFVRRNGRTYERWSAWRTHRAPMDLDHSARARAGHDMGAIRPPPGGRAPGWIAGLELARRQSSP